MSDEIVLGIDLGTTFSAMAVVDRFGKPVIVPNAEGQPTTPSVIHFYDRDSCVVGDEAVKMVVVDPANVVRFIKRNMGEPDYTLEFFGRSYTPQELSAIILKKLKEDAKEALGVEIKDAVITVPAYFNTAQRSATAEAGAIAGLNVLSVINEPTTAAIAYGIERLGGRGGNHRPQGHRQQGCGPPTDPCERRDRTHRPGPPTPTLGRHRALKHLVHHTSFSARIAGFLTPCLP